MRDKTEIYAAKESEMLRLDHPTKDEMALMSLEDLHEVYLTVMKSITATKKMKNDQEFRKELFLGAAWSGKFLQFIDIFDEVNL